jgi:hypothetical protein
MLRLLLLLAMRLLLLRGWRGVQSSATKSLKSNFCGVFSRVVNVLAVVPESGWDRAAFNLDSARPSSTAS